MSLKQPNLISTVAASDRLAGAYRLQHDGNGVGDAAIGGLRQTEGELALISEAFAFRQGLLFFFSRLAQVQRIISVHQPLPMLESLIVFQAR